MATHLISPFQVGQLVNNYVVLYVCHMYISTSTVTGFGFVSACCKMISLLRCIDSRSFIMETS
jgi:hypothetical protein